MSDSWVIAGIKHELFELIQRITDYKLENFTYMSPDKQTSGLKLNNPVYKMCPTQLCLHSFTACSKPRDQAPSSYKYITHFMHDSKTSSGFIGMRRGPEVFLDVCLAPPP